MARYKCIKQLNEVHRGAKPRYLCKPYWKVREPQYTQKIKNYQMFNCKIPIKKIGSVSRLLSVAYLGGTGGLGMADSKILRFTNQTQWSQASLLFVKNLRIKNTANCLGLGPLYFFRIGKNYVLSNISKKKSSKIV